MIKRVLTVLVALALLVAPITVSPAVVSAFVGTPSLSVNPDTIGGSTTTLVLSNVRVTTALPATGTISLVMNTFVFASDYTFTTFYSNPSVAGSFTVSSNASAKTVTLTFPAGLPSTQPYTFYLYPQGFISNPSVAGTAPITLNTSTPETTSLSVSFASSVQSLQVQPTPATVGSTAAYQITFRQVSTPPLFPSEQVFIEFPTGTYIPSSLCAACFSVNGYPMSLPGGSVAPISNGLRLTLPTVFAPPAPNSGDGKFYYTVSIDSSGGIRNPSTIGGSHTLGLWTSRDTTKATTTFTLQGTFISSLALTATPTSQSAYPELRFTFTTSSSGALTTSDYVYIQIPSSMSPPSSIAASAITVNSAQVASSSSISSGKLSIRMPVSVGNSQQVTVVIAATSGLRNPSTVGTSVSFDVSTSQDVGTRSISYTTTISQIAPPQVTLTTNGVGKPSGYTVVFNTGAGGLLSANVGVIYIVFPAGTVVPASILGQNVRVNGSVASVVSSNSTTRRVEIRTPIAVQASTQVTVVIDVAANIVNPSTAGTSYTLAAYTSAETTLVNSAVYAIVNLPVSTAVTFPVNPDGLNSYYKTRPSVTITATSPSGYPVSIYYRINAGADTLYASPVQIPDGIVTLSYYARDSQSNQEAPRQLTFKVDATAPVVTILTPQAGSTTGTAIAAVTGRTEAGATVTINGSAVAVQPSGDFGGSVTLTEGANSIQVVATDVAGNVDQKAVAVTLDTKPPVLTVTSPKIYATVMTHQVTVTGRTEVGATLHIAGTTTEVAADGTFSFVYMFPKDGLNVIDITATDASGNTARASIPVTYVARTLIRLQVGNKTAMINDAVKALQAAPVNIKGTVMVPIRLISEAFGATVEWEPVFKLVRLQLGDKVIYLQIGSKSASVNGKTNTLLAAPIIVSGTTMVPIRFISEAFDALVVWIDATKGIEITYPKP